MLTEGPPTDPKCMLNMPSFLKLPHLSDCLICTRNSISIVFLLKMVGERDRWGGGWLLYNKVCEGGQGVDIIL